MNYITDEMVVKRANNAVKLALEKNRALDVPSNEDIKKNVDLMENFL